MKIVVEDQAAGASYPYGDFLRQTIKRRLADSRRQLIDLVQVVPVHGVGRAISCLYNDALAPRGELILEFLDADQLRREFKCADNDDARCANEWRTQGRISRRQFGSI